jgi:hypothetical protein
MLHKSLLTLRRQLKMLSNCPPLLLSCLPLFLKLHTDVNKSPTIVIKLSTDIDKLLHDVCELPNVVMNLNMLLWSCIHLLWKYGASLWWALDIALEFTRASLDFPEDHCRLLWSIDCRRCGPRYIVHNIHSTLIRSVCNFGILWLQLQL